MTPLRVQRLAHERRSGSGKRRERARRHPQRTTCQIRWSVEQGFDLLLAKLRELELREQKLREQKLTEHAMKAGEQVHDGSKPSGDSHNR